MTSYKTHEIKYNAPKGFKDNANDLTIATKPQVQVISVDGVAPGDPEAEYTLEGDGTGDIKIRDIDKADGDTLKIRLKNAGRPTATLTTVFWTKDGVRIPRAAEMLSTVAIDAPLEPVLVVEESLKPVVDRLESLSVQMDRLAGLRVSAVRGDPG